MSDQLDFTFAGAPGPDSCPLDGLEAWREGRRREMRAIAVKHGLPLGHRVRVEFANGPSIEGLLLFDESTPARKRSDPHATLRIGGAKFHHDEITACVRLD